ncbi:MAG: protein-S-isoprenylcysteine O-methyltransferase [Nitratireductor sp.]
MNTILGYDLTHIGKAVWCVYMVLWATIRFRPNKASRKTSISFTNRAPVERFSMIVSTLGLGVVPAIWVFTGFPKQFDHQTNIFILIVGVIIAVSALILFRKTHKALGKMWSHSLDLREGHKLVSEGVYKNVRHPMYSAFWLWAVALPFLLTNWVAGFAGIVGFGTLYFLRVGQEEKMMEEQFGQEYRDYCERTKRIIPGIH